MGRMCFSAGEMFGKGAISEISKQPNVQTGLTVTKVSKLFYFLQY